MSQSAGVGSSIPRGQKSLIVQGDKTILLEVNQEGYGEARDQLSLFAELEKCPEHVHTYRITSLSLWNAAASGLSSEDIGTFLLENSRYDVSPSLIKEIDETIRRFGLLKLIRREGDLVLIGETKLLRDMARAATLKPCIETLEDDGSWIIHPESRGEVKQALIKLGYPVEDIAGYSQGKSFEIRRRDVCKKSGQTFALRPYQDGAADAFHAGGTERGGSGVVVLPCGAGKTVVAIGVMERLQTRTLILTTNTVAVRQWRSELLDKTMIAEEDIGEYTGTSKAIRPITIATYQILTYRKSKSDSFLHFDLFSADDWGLIVYDEVHLLPAPVFRVTADIQARRRLGLTATLVREDNKEDDVFSLIGPKKYDVPWKVLERQGWIASAHCVELRIPLPEERRYDYLAAPQRDKFRIASENALKLPVIESLLRIHSEDLILIIGQYLDQLDEVASRLSAPVISGRTPLAERQELYQAFRRGLIPVLVVSKVGNFAIDLPDANVAIQISGTFGSRQEEAQRLGRILRPKGEGVSATFYSLVTRDSREQDFAANRQLFLTEQGYTYEIRDVGTLPPVNDIEPLS